MSDPFVIDEYVAFEADGLVLEGLLSYRDDAPPGRKVLLLPPHPHFAGDMNNNVIRAAASELAGTGRAVLRFNYHGVEGSEGPSLEGESVFDYWRRVEEQRDYGRAVMDGIGAYRFLAELMPDTRRGCLVMGYSFGALIAALAAPGLPAIEGLVLLSPPFGKIDLSRVKAPGCPVLVMAGEKDFIFDAAALELAGARLGGEIRMEFFPESDHFFRGEERRPIDKMISFFDRWGDHE